MKIGLETVGVTYVDNDEIDGADGAILTNSTEARNSVYAVANSNDWISFSDLDIEGASAIDVSYSMKKSW